VESAEHVPKRRPAMPEHQKDDTQQRRETDLDRDKAEDVLPASTQESPELLGELSSRERRGGLDMFSILAVLTVRRS